MSMSSDQLASMLGIKNPVQLPEKELKVLLNKLENPSPIKDEAQYADYRKLSSELCSLEVTTFNQDHPLNDQVHRLEMSYNQCLYRWMTKTRLITNSFTKRLANYLVMSRYFPRYNDAVYLEAIAQKLLAANALYQSKDRLVVAGFNYKLGDNTFRVDRQGRYHRQYGRSAAPLAIPVDYSKSKILEDWFKDKEIPELPEEYRVVYIASAKGCVRSPRFTQADQEAMANFFQSVKNV